MGAIAADDWTPIRAFGNVRPTPLNSGCEKGKKEMLRNAALAFTAVAALAAFGVTPASAQQQKVYCVAKLPFPLKNGSNQPGQLVIYQAYVNQVVGTSSTVFSVHAQLQNQSTGTIKVVVNTAELTPPPGGGIWSAGDQTTYTLTSYQPVDTTIAKLTVNTQTNTSPVQAWNVVDRLIAPCRISRG